MEGNTYNTSDENVHRYMQLMMAWAVFEDDGEEEARKLFPDQIGYILERRHLDYKDFLDLVSEELGLKS